MKRKILSGLMGLAMLGVAGGVMAAPFTLASVSGGKGTFTVSGFEGGVGDNTFTITLDSSASGGPVPGVSVGAAGILSGSYSVMFPANGGYLTLTNGTVTVDGNLMLGVVPGTNTPTPQYPFDKIGSYTNELDTVSHANSGILHAPLTFSYDAAGNYAGGSVAAGYVAHFDTNYAGLAMLMGMAGITSTDNGDGMVHVDLTIGANSVIADITDTPVVTGTWAGYVPFLKALDDQLDALALPWNPPANRVNDSIKGVYTSDFTIQSVPEPASLALLGLGIAGLGFMRRRKA